MLCGRRSTRPTCRACRRTWQARGMGFGWQSGPAVPIVPSAAAAAAGGAQRSSQALSSMPAYLPACSLALPLRPAAPALKLPVFVNTSVVGTAGARTTLTMPDISEFDQLELDFILGCTGPSDTSCPLWVRRASAACTPEGCRSSGCCKQALEPAGSVSPCSSDGSPHPIPCLPPSCPRPAAGPSSAALRLLRQC